jgi:diadenosine tetraphosphate (Ap4A) HIT family hydrolase
MSTAIHRMVESCRKGTYAATVARLTSGWVVMGTSQVIQGYCLLLPDPVVSDLNALPFAQRMQFLQDMAKLGDALLNVTDAVRINYAMFGNQEPALHAHVFPRYHDEPQALRAQHPWAYDWSQAPRFDVDIHGDLLEAIRHELFSSTASAPF